jgi:hypothetical protein
LSKTFVDQIPPETGRKYNIISNGDGTSSIVDVTVYTQEGTAWGAVDANQAMRKEDYESGGAVAVAAGGTGAKTAETARTNLGAAAITDVTVLQNAASPKLTAGTAPSFTVADTTVTEYANGLRRTIVAHADSGTAPTLNFNSKGAKSVYQSTGKAASWKAGQHVVVEYDGTYFFVCSAGGGVEFPATQSAGDTPVYAVVGASKNLPAAYAYIGAGWGITANKAGTYRFKYCASTLRTGTSYISYLKLQKNGVDVANSEIIATATVAEIGYVTKTIDVTLAAGDIIKLLGYYAATYGTANYFVVSILAADVQSAIGELITPST